MSATPWAAPHPDSATSTASVLVHAAGQQEPALRAPAAPEELWWGLVIALLVAATHLWGRRVHRRIFKSERVAMSFGGGMTAAYVFTHVIPEIETGHELFGKSIHLVTLAGLIAFYALESWSHTREARTHSTHRTFAVHMAFGALYNWLLIFGLPNSFRADGFLMSLLLSVALGLHLLHADAGLEERFPGHFRTWGRPILAAAALLGWLTDVFVDPSPVIEDLMLALLAGFVIMGVLKEEVPDAREASVLWFLAGAIAFVLPMELGALLGA